MEVEFSLKFSSKDDPDLVTETLLHLQNAVRELNPRRRQGRPRQMQPMQNGNGRWPTGVAPEDVYQDDNGNLLQYIGNVNEG